MSARNDDPSAFSQTVEMIRLSLAAERSDMLADLGKISRRGRLVRGRWSKTTPIAVLRATWARTVAVESSILGR